MKSRRKTSTFTCKNKFKTSEETPASRRNASGIQNFITIPQQVIPTQVLQVALKAKVAHCELPPVTVIDMLRQAISIVGNASFCGTSDRRKGLLAKLALECLDYLDDKALFTRGHTDLFGKKFKKNLLKDLKLTKEIDNLMPRKRQSSFSQLTRRFQPGQPLHVQPGKGPGFRSKPFKRWENKTRKPYQFPPRPNQNN